MLIILRDFIGNKKFGILLMGEYTYLQHPPGVARGKTDC